MTNEGKILRFEPPKPSKDSKDNPEQIGEADKKRADVVILDPFELKNHNKMPQRTDEEIQAGIERAHAAKKDLLERTQTLVKSLERGVSRAILLARNANTPDELEKRDRQINNIELQIQHIRDMSRDWGYRHEHAALRNRITEIERKLNEARRISAEKDGDVTLPS